jgi:hypothetical protein
MGKVYVVCAAMFTGFTIAMCGHDSAARGIGWVACIVSAAVMLTVAVAEKILGMGGMG